MSTPAGASDERAESGERAAGDRRQALRGGLAAAVAVGLAWAGLSVVLDVHLGLLVVAAVGGWIVGAAVARAALGAWPIAVASAGLAWLIGAALSYLLSQLLLPQAVTPLAERLSLAGLLDYTTQTFDLVQAVALAILLVEAWRSAR